MTTPDPEQLVQDTDMDKLDKAEVIAETEVVQAPEPVPTVVPSGESAQDLFTVIQKLQDDEEGDLGFSPLEPKTELETKFRAAAKTGDVRLIRGMLRKAVVDVNCSHARTLQTALHVACAFDQLEVVEFLLTQEDVQIEAKDFYGNTPDMLVKGSKNANNIHKAINAKLVALGADGEEGEINITKKYGKIAEVSSMPGSFKSHVFICHHRSNNKAAIAIREKLSELGIVSSMTKGLMPKSSDIETNIRNSKMVLILTSKKFFSTIKSAGEYANSGCVMELEAIAYEKDVSQIMVAALDNKREDDWGGQYQSVSGDGVVVDFSNEKAISENLPGLYNEIKIGVLA